MDDKQPLSAAAPEQKKQDPEEVKRQISFFKQVKIGSSARKERLEDLMQRRSSAKWDAAKKAKMVRRLMTANQELEQSVAALDQLELLLIQLVADEHKRVNEVAPFVPPPATST